MTNRDGISTADAILQKCVPLSSQVTGKDITLKRMRKIMSALGNPEKNLNVIHIAGTSGKTSTSYYITRMLQLSGEKTGLTISPHVDSVRERVQINLELMTDKEFCDELKTVIDILENKQLTPTYFELLVALAYWYFSKEKVNYAVTETGMGGLHDGTNIAGNPNKLCIITDIGMDHLQVLGHTVADIARQKAGIIHNKNAVLLYRQGDKIMKVIKNQCDQKDASIHIFEQNTLAALNDVSYLPTFQQRNWLLAYEAFKLIQARDSLRGLHIIELKKSMALQVPGRMDLVQVAGKTIIMDGAHNEQKMQAFVDSFKQKFPDRKVPVLLSLKLGKVSSVVLKLLKQVTSTLIITEFTGGQDLPGEAMDAQELAEAAIKLNYKDVLIEISPEHAYKKLLEFADNTAIITGSFYIISQLRQIKPELRHATN
ncbi:MAG: Mur ligase family protein [bacterium]|nr:Mur ligase family protein [bacterium]